MSLRDASGLAETWLRQAQSDPVPRPSPPAGATDHRRGRLRGRAGTRPSDPGRTPRTANSPDTGTSPPTQIHRSLLTSYIIRPMFPPTSRSRRWEPGRSHRLYLESEQPWSSDIVAGHRGRGALPVLTDEPAVPKPTRALMTTPPRQARRPPPQRARLVTTADPYGYVIVPPEAARSGHRFDRSTPHALRRGGGGDSTDTPSTVSWTRHRYHMGPARSRSAVLTPGP